MSKVLLEIFLCIILGVFYGLLVRYLDADSVIISLLILIFVKLVVRGTDYE